MINPAVVYTKERKLIVHNIMTFGEWLRAEITKAGVSNAEVARRAKISPTYVGNLMRDFSQNATKKGSRPSEKVVAAIAKALNADLNDALRAAGYLERESDNSFFIEVDNAKVRISLHGGHKLTDEEREDFITHFKIAFETAKRINAEKRVREA